MLIARRDACRERELVDSDFATPDGFLPSRRGRRRLRVEMLLPRSITPTNGRRILRLSAGRAGTVPPSAKLARANCRYHRTRLLAPKVIGRSISFLFRE